MNMQKKIEQSLRAVPKPPAPDGLLDKLQQDIPAQDIKTHRSSLHRWFAPAGGSISPWRVAAATAIAIAVLLPLSYGATKTVKHIIKTFEAKFVYPQDDGGAHVYGVGAGIGSSDPNFTEEDALEKQQEFYQLYKEGKAEEIKPGIWVAILSDGEAFGFSGDPEFLGLSDAERRDLLKKQFDEIHELRKAGKYERTFIKEVEKNGVKIRLYEDRFTLSNGKVITMGAGEGEQVKGEDDKD